MSCKHYTHRHDAGFTVIELMAVIAIVSILAVVAMTAYSDYVVRSKVSEGLNFAAEAKTTVSEYFYSNGYVMPGSNKAAGLPEPGSYNTYEFVERLEIVSSPRPGVIEITFDIDELGTDNILQLVPATVRNLISWTCIPPPTNGISENRVPSVCRGN